MSSAASRQEILLESGTNEMEIIEFYLGTQSFGINVQKLKEIVPYDAKAVTAIPDSPPSMLGTLLLRGHTIPLINLKGHIRHTAAASEGSRQVVLVCEFNDRINGFLVDGVNQIHRISWQQVQPMAVYIDQFRPRFTGSVSIDGRDILIVDLECIIAEVDPEADLDFSHRVGELPLEERRAGKKLMLAEDSAIIREGIHRVLTAAGYSDLQVFDNGEDCLRAIVKIAEQAKAGGEPVEQQLNLLISDIEMPRMDGLTLCRQVKKELRLKDVTVLMFSSLINEQMVLKCKSVGADGYVTKPQIPELVGLMDHYLGI